MKKNKKGFTLIELLVVIAIIGLLATLSVIALNTARVKARDARRVSDVKQIQTALEMYFDEKSYYPNPVTNGSVPTSSYISSVPTNPQPVDTGCPANTNYIYNSATGSTYTLSYCLSSSNVNNGPATATPAGIR